MSLQTYITAFDLLAQSAKLKPMPAPSWKLSPQVRGLLIVVFLAVLTVGLGSVAVVTTFTCLPLIALGLCYGMVLSYPATRFLSSRLQSAVAAFTGGLTAGNIGSRQAQLRSGVIALSRWINLQVSTLLPQNPPQSVHLNDAIVWCVWTTILSTLAIMLANAYFANVESNLVGHPTGMVSGQGSAQAESSLVAKPAGA